MAVVIDSQPCLNLPPIFTRFNRYIQMNSPSAKHTVKHFPMLMRDALLELLRNDPLRMAGATAFFTTFALPPILLINIQVLSLVFNRRTISRQLFQHLATVLGKEPVRQVVQIVGAVRKMGQNWWITIGGFIFLLFVATTLFKVIINSVNQIWNIKMIDNRGFILTLKNRLHAVVVILIAGLLFVLSLMVEGLQAMLGKYLFELSPLAAGYFKGVVSYIVSIIVVTAWFAVIFRYLPDGRPLWRVALAGALLTSILFNIGKLILHWLLSRSNITTVYGASGSIVLLLLFVFYCSLILYYGTAFTKIWGIWSGKPIKPLPHAVYYRLAEVEIKP
jgi:membrane protein